MHDLEDLPLDQQLAVREARRRLTEEFGDTVGEETIYQVLAASWAHIEAGARIKHHVPLLAERFARAELRAFARMNGQHDGTPAVLFLDRHDSGRGKMAKVLLADKLNGQVIAMSAGTDPDVIVSPVIIEVMKEWDLHLEHAFPKPYTSQMLQAADIIVTFGDACTLGIPSGANHESWQVQDPRDLDAEQVRAIRGDLSERIDDMITRLPRT